MEKFQMKGNIVLTAEEERIFDLLKRAATKCNTGVVMRVAGGWVRDKVNLMTHRKVAWA